MAKTCRVGRPCAPVGHVGTLGVRRTLSGHVLDRQPVQLGQPLDTGRERDGRDAAELLLTLILTHDKCAYRESALVAWGFAIRGVPSSMDAPSGGTFHPSPFGGHHAVESSGA